MAEVLLIAGLLDPDELRAARGLVARLARRGIAVRVACASAAGPLPEGLELLEFPGLGSPWRRDWSVRRLPLDGDGRPDLLHVIGADMAQAGLAVAEHWGLPYLLTCDEFLAPGSTIRLSRRWIRALIATGQDLAEDLIAGFGIPESLIEVIPEGVELPDLDADGRPEVTVPVVGTSGDLAIGGGLPTYFEAARRLLESGRDVEFVVDGQGRDEAALRRLAARMGIAERVTFADDLDIGPAFWRVLDVFCRISIVPDAGRTLGPALAFGVPVVVSDVPGLRRWVIPGETGLVIPPDDAGALALAIRDLLDDRPRAREYGRRGRLWIVENHDLACEAEALVAAYLRALAAPGPGVAVTTTTIPAARSETPSPHGIRQAGS